MIRQFDEINFALVLAFPFADIGIESAAQVCAQNRAYTERKCLVAFFHQIGYLALNLIVDDGG